MKTRSPLSITILYWLFNVATVLMALVVIAVLFVNVLLQTDVIGQDLQLHAQLPALVDIEQTGTFTKNGTVTDIELVEATAKIHFIDTPGFIAKRIAIVLIFVSILAFFISWAIRTIMKNVYTGEIFVLQNVKWLQRLAFLIAGLWLVTQIYSRWFTIYLISGIEMDNVTFRMGIDFLDNTILLAIFIWVLAHIFNVGLKLQEESDLTV